MATVAQGRGCRVSADAGGAGAGSPEAGGDGDSNPITIDPGKGWFIKLPVPRDVVRKLGGSAELAERVRPILDTTPDHYDELAPDAADRLTAAYDELLRHLEAVTRQDGRG
jgi:hypothetical protein